MDLKERKTGDLQQHLKYFLDKATTLTMEAEQLNDPATMRWLARRLEEAQALINGKLGGLQGRLHAKAFGRE